MNTLRRFSLVAAFLLLLSTLAVTQTFTSKTIPVGNTPAKLIRGDFNGDGKADLITANGDGSITVLLGNGDATFSRQDYVVGTRLVDMRMADVNNDDKSDLILTDATSDTARRILVLLGKGDGTFQGPIVTSPSFSAVSITVGDYNKDNKIDIAAGWVTSDGVNHIAILNGDGTGHFTVSKTYDGVGHKAESGEEPYRLTAMNTIDMDGDGDPDIVFIECCGGVDVEMGAIYMMRNDGSGNFTGVDIGTLSVPRSFTAADIDKNGQGDLIISYSGCHTPCRGVIIDKNAAVSPSRVGVASDSFPGADIYSFGDSTAADFTGDGRIDVAYAIYGNQYMQSDFTGMVLATQGSDGTFISNRAFLTTDGAQLSSLVHGDFTGDKKEDVAALTSAGDIIIYRNTTTTVETGPCPAVFDRTVRICQPSGDTGSPSPVHVVAGLRSDAGVTAAQIYVDGTKVWQSSSATTKVDQQIPMSVGSHKITVKGWDAKGAFSSTVTVGVQSACIYPDNRTATICSPMDGANVSSPFNVEAHFRSDTGITAAQIYVDGQKMWQFGPGTTSVSAGIPPLSIGSHRITAKGWDSIGSFSKSITVNVTSTTGSCVTIADRSVTICSPQSGATVSSPVKLEAALRADSGVQATQVYVDGVKVWQGPAGSTYVNQSLSMSAGSHHITVKGWDKFGAFSGGVNFTVK